jgi:hypothetical protein
LSTLEVTASNAGDASEPRENIAEGQRRADAVRRAPDDSAAEVASPTVPGSDLPSGAWSSPMGWRRATQIADSTTTSSTGQTASNDVMIQCGTKPLQL